MSVGKGSLQRAAKANDVKVPAAKTVEVKEVKKVAVAKAPAKKETPVVAASVISSDSIHEMKFQAVSKIHCDLPTYLL